jgi:hypothetical protein
VGMSVCSTRRVKKLIANFELVNPAVNNIENYTINHVLTFQRFIVTVSAVSSAPHMLDALGI